MKVSKERLYRLVELPRAGQHTPGLELDRGGSDYAFKFGQGPGRRAEKTRL